MIKVKISNIFLYIFCFFVVYSNAQTKINGLNNNRAIYKPGDTVITAINFSNTVSDSKLKLEYYHLNERIYSDSIMNISGNGAEVYWTAPAGDYKGYLLNVVLYSGETAQDTANIAVDVSSDWKKFPRYGFLSKYSYMTSADINAIIDNLNRHHINGIQYYDWHWKHHLPLKGEPGNVASTWQNIANQYVYLSTVQRYLDAAEKRGMSSMAYNLLFGAYADAEKDGVSNEWRIFQDRGHQSPDLHDLPSGWASDIYLMDYSNNYWVYYINNQMAKVFEALNFTGWHIDQLGDRGARYKYNGQQINMEGAFKPFLDSAKAKLNVPLVANAVNNYAQNYIAKGDVDFLYTEVWTPNDKYSDLASIIFYNNAFSKNTKNSVLAAYVNKGKSNSKGYFNTPSVLFTNAVIFAAGGSHIELGEHMLANEYFPNNNLSMTPELKSSLVNYYDFLTAYENILRDELQPMPVTVSSPDKGVSTWPPQQGKLWVFSRAKENRLILNIVNFTEAATMNWRDDGGIQKAPQLLENVKLNILKPGQIDNVWYASADNKSLVPADIEYTSTDTSVTLTVPKIKYWSTVVVEYKDNITGLEEAEINDKSFRLSQNYPNPFNPVTSIEYNVAETAEVSLKVFDVLGNEVAELVNESKPAGSYKAAFNASALSSGIYFYRLRTGDFSETKKMIYLK